MPASQSSTSSASSANTLVTHRLGNGMTFVCEPRDTVSSAAITWLLPCGLSSDPADRIGRSVMLGEMMLRGAGGLDSRRLSDEFERLGASRSSHVGNANLQIGLTVLGSNVANVLPLLVAMVNDPALDEADVDPVRSLCLQSLDALHDEPQAMVMDRLAQRHEPPPFNRSNYGDRDGFMATTREDIVEAWKQRIRPDHSIFAISGAVDPDRIAAHLQTLLADWSGMAHEPTVLGPPLGENEHLEQDTSQVHIGLACEAPPDNHADTMLERFAIVVLGGSTSGRLFTEVRQKRSLCYSVSARYQPGRDRGRIYAYAGTTPERANETLDVMCAEFKRMSAEGVTAEEFGRAAIQLKSNIVMQGESTAARASSLAADHYRRGQARTLEEVISEVDAVSLDALNSYLSSRDFGPMTRVHIGPDPLK